MRSSLLFVGLALGLTGCFDFNGAADLAMGRDGASAGGASSPTGPGDTDTTTDNSNSGPDGQNPQALNCDAPTPGPAPMRRLSHVEYRYALEDLFGNATLARTVSASLVSDPVSLGFSNSAQLLDVKPVLGQQYMEAAEKVAETVTANLATLLPCDPAVDGEVACATQFIQKLGRRAYRRPLTQEELTRYVNGFQTLRAQYDVRTGIEWMVSTMLQAPSFLYRPEISDASDTREVRPVAPYELASRLSFLLWHSVPDDALLAAAAEGRLNTQADVEREARRLLADARGARVLNFFEEWLDVDKLGQYAREAAVFGTLPSGLPNLFREETRSFVHHVLFEGDGRLSTLLTADFTFANQTLADHYGLPAVANADFVKVALPQGRRGVWMQGGPLTSHDKLTRTSIVNRGVRVRTALLCQNIPAPPDDVVLELGPIDQTASQKERLAEHRTNATCAGCHNLMDPIGQVFENVDAVGRLRTVDETGRVAETVGEVTSTVDADGAVANGEELMARLSESEQVRQCFATQLFRYVHGREEVAQDACSQKQAYDRFVGADLDIRELILGVVLSDDFLYRRVEH